MSNRAFVLALMGTALSAAVMLCAQGQTGSIEKKTKVHRLTSAQRAVYDAFVYANRIPEKAEDGETGVDLAGRILGRLANQEGRILLKAPPGMNLESYHGLKTFFREEGNASAGNCAACHTPAEFADLKSHVVTKGGSPTATPSLRNLKKKKVDLRQAILTKIAASHQKKSGEADEIDDAYAAMDIGEEDVAGLVTFLDLLNDIPESDFRGLITKAELLDTSQELEPAVAAAPADPVSAITGVIRFEGPPPERKPIQLTPDSRELYDAAPLDERVLVSEKGEIANVFVYVKRGVEKKDYPVPTKPAVVNQDKSMFRPRVQGVMVGQELLMRNSDPFIHNVRSMSLKNRPFNIGQPANTPDRKKVFDKQEGPIRLGCDFHPWMTAYVFAMEHPYFAVSDEKGQFKIEGLPPGEYTLEAWHEVFGDQRQKITVGESATKSEFTFKPAAE